MRQENATNIIIAYYDEKRININDLMYAFSLDRQGIYDFTSLLETFSAGALNYPNYPNSLRPKCVSSLRSPKVSTKVISQ